VHHDRRAQYAKSLVKFRASPPVTRHGAASTGGLREFESLALPSATRSRVSKPVERYSVDGKLVRNDDADDEDGDAATLADDVACVVCTKTSDGDKMLLCDGACNRGFHIYW
jgi:hypothetical protein